MSVTPPGEVGGIDLVALTRQCAAEFDGVAANHPTTVRRLTVGDVRIRLRLVGGWRQQPALDAISHISRNELATDCKAHLMIDAWDGPSNLNGFPEPGWYRSDHAGILAAYVDRPRLVEILDRSADRAYCWAADADAVPGPSRVRPFMSILGAWLGSRGMPPLHAAAVGDSGGAVLLVGPGGSGKSTTALACAERGLQLVGDDVCAFEIGTRTVHSVYRTVKLRTDSAERFVHHRLEDVDGEHHTIMPQHLALMRAPVRAVVALSSASPRSIPRLEPMPSAAGIGLLAPTRLVAHFAGEAGIRPWIEAVRALSALPLFVLHLGWDLDTVARLVSQVLSDSQ